MDAFKGRHFERLAEQVLGYAMDNSDRACWEVVWEEWDIEDITEVLETHDVRGLCTALALFAEIGEVMIEQAA